MQLRNLEYQEHVGDPREWSLAPTEFTNVTLVVGKNASGKTRLLNVLSGHTCGCFSLLGHVTTEYRTNDELAAAADKVCPPYAEAIKSVTQV